MTDQEHEHEHDHDVDPHEHGPARIMPLPVPQSVSVDLVQLEDGSERILVSYWGYNGQWHVYYDRDGAKNFASQLLTQAYAPPAPALQVEEEPAS